jgi:hypothetical protein
MYLQKVISKNLRKKDFVGILKVTVEKSRIQIRVRIHKSVVPLIPVSGRVYQNVKDPQHWYLPTGTFCVP